MKENSIEDRIEEKYTRYINCETDILELTIEEAIFILEKDASVHYVEDLLQEAYKVILSDYKRLQEEFKQVDHECERLKKREEILNKYKLALFMVIRNSTVMPQGIKLGKADKEINEMSYETMCSVLTMIDYDQAKKFYEEGEDGRK